MTQTDATMFWLNTAQETRNAARDTLQSNHPDWSFFLWHLAIEKLLKGLLIKKGETPIPTHNLLLLAKNAKLDILQQQTDLLREITTYNIEARYDDYKRSFYKKVTKPAYIKEWVPICEKVFIWLEKQY